MRGERAIFFGGEWPVLGGGGSPSKRASRKPCKHGKYVYIHTPILINIWFHLFIGT